ncbi:MAG: hypothetical protein R3282_04590 [Rhodothermales bacterium]|nr:hypothetical protein [Rhodothermales bacterium]
MVRRDDSGRSSGVVDENRRKRSEPSLKGRGDRGRTGDATGRSRVRGQRDDERRTNRGSGRHRNGDRDDEYRANRGSVGQSSGGRAEVGGRRSGGSASKGKGAIYLGDRKPVRYRNRTPQHRNGSDHYGSYYGKHNRKHYGGFHRHNRRHLAKYGWCNAYHPAGHHHYVNAHIHIGSHVHIGITWPWQKRYHRHWRPRYRYRQVVHVDVGWGGHRRSSRVDVRTYYRHRVLHANDRYADIEIEIDAIELYQNDRYLSTVDRIPGQLRKIRATVYADGRIDFDRNVFVVGDAHSGFELIATRYYNDYLYNAYDSHHGYRVGRVDLRRGRVHMKKHSRLFDPYNFDGFVPISLLPDDDRLWDYGAPYLDSRYDDDGEAGWYRNYRDRAYDDDYELSRSFEASYRTPQGAEIRMERSTVLDRL